MKKLLTFPRSRGYKVYQSKFYINTNLNRKKKYGQS